jgi:phage-related minor tail protein
MRTPLEVLTDTYAELNRMQDLGAISQETYNRAIASAQEEFDKATGAAKAWDDTMVETRTTADNMETALVNSFQSAGDAIAQFAMGGKVSVSGMVQSMIADFIRLEARMQMMSLYQNAGGLSSGIMGMFGFGGGGGIDTSFTSGLGSATSSGAMDYAAMSFDGGGFTGSGSRSGGMDGKGGFPAILHPNETVIDHTKGGLVGNSTTVNVINNSGAQATTRETMDSRGNRSVEVVIGDMVAGEMGRAGSAAYNAQRNTFGLRPALVGR